MSASPSEPAKARLRVVAMEQGFSWLLGGVGTGKRISVVTAGTPAAEREERRAEMDLRSGPTRVFESPEDRAKKLTQSSRKK